MKGLAPWRAIEGYSFPTSPCSYPEGGALHRVSRQCVPVSSLGCRRLIRCLLAPAPQPLGAGLKLRWLHPTCACATHRCLLDGIPSLRLPGSAVYPRIRPLRTSREPGGEAFTPARGGRGLHPHGALSYEMNFHLAICPEVKTSLRSTDHTKLASMHVPAVMTRASSASDGS
jgi:hypothetical protein